MSKTKQEILNSIDKALDVAIRYKHTGQVSFEINVSQGGFGECKIRIDGNLETMPLFPQGNE